MLGFPLHPRISPPSFLQYFSGYLCRDSDSIFYCLASVALSHSGGRTFDHHNLMSFMLPRQTSCFPIQYQADDVAKSFPLRIEPGLLGPPLQQLLYADTGGDLPWVITYQLWGPHKASVHRLGPLLCGILPSGSLSDSSRAEERLPRNGANLFKDHSLFQPMAWLQP